MEINFNTDRLIVLVFPSGAGGKFLSLCLNLNHNVLIQDEQLAKIQMQMIDNKKFSHALAIRTFDKKLETSNHYEYQCGRLLGYNGLLGKLNKQDQNMVTNKLFKELTNQDQFFFFLMDHIDGDVFKDYPNRKTIRLHNYKWILDARSYEFDQEWAKENDLRREQGFWFDMDSIKDGKKFYDEICSVSRYLGLNFDQAERLETLRMKFLQTFKMGFNTGGKI
tara:strand:- start:1035 stop:1700 length:666 start_codon:yes stop_codon:yes gene_type:complete